MIRSMTGFGRGEASDGECVASVEIKTVNHRYAEIAVRMSSRYAFAEDALRSLIKAGIGRGKADVCVTVTGAAGGSGAVVLDEDLAKQYFAKLRELQDRFDVSGEITLELLAGLPDVIMQGTPETDEEAVAGLLLEAASEALRSLDEMRRREGANLAKDIACKFSEIEGITAEIAEKAPEIPALYSKKLTERIAALHSGTVESAVLEQRVALETALLADKASIDEELVRLGSHLEQFRRIVAGEDEEPVGKKLDFIVQEMNREVNTVGSKAHDLGISAAVIDLKALIEETREQIQNIR